VLSKQYKPYGGRFFLSADRNKANELLLRILNQNEAAQALFYLHPDSTIGLAEEAVVLLRVSIALRAQDHYDELLESRTGGLGSEFAAKLGWLCGNIYSRIAVPDWSDPPSRAEEAQRLVDDLLNGSDPDGPQFIDQRSIEKQLKSTPNPFTEAEIKELLARSNGKTYKQLALDEVRKVLSESGVAPKQTDQVVNGLSNSPTFTELVKKGRE
jgi:hypothetical protein